MIDKKGDTYQRYLSRVKKAQSLGYSNDLIIGELLRERLSLTGRSQMKAATLATDRNIYKKREALRLAGECRSAIDLLVEELGKKESLV